MPVGAALGGAAGSIGSALIGSNAAQTASQQQLAGEQAGINAQLSMYNQTRSDLSPYRTTGASALSSIADMYGLAGGTGANAGGTGSGVQNFSAFTNSPDYQFAQQQGDQAVNRTAAANGQLMSGGQAKAAQEFGQGLASQQFSNYFNRLMSLSNMGESASAQTGALGQQTANQISALSGAQGASAAAGTVGSANALSGGLSALTGYGMLGRTGSSYGSSTGSSFGTGSSGGASNNAYGMGALASLGQSTNNFGNTFSGGLLSSLFSGG